MSKEMLMKKQPHVYNNMIYACLFSELGFITTMSKNTSKMVIDSVSKSNDVKWCIDTHLENAQNKFASDERSKKKYARRMFERELYDYLSNSFKNKPSDPPDEINISFKSQL